MSGNSHQVFSDARVLVVEDNKVNQKVIIAMLQRFGITPDIAVNGKEAIALVAQNKYNLILMDCIMPIMDGYAATIHIRNGRSDGRSG